MIDPGELLANLRYVLTKVENAAVTANYVLPDRRYVTVGGSVFDCPQVVVSAMSSAPGPVSAEPGAVNLLGACEGTWNATMEAAIVVPAAEQIETQRGGGYTAPAVALVEADTLSISAAYATLRNAIDDVIASNDVGAITATFQFGQPSGGLIAVVATINLNLWIPAAP